MASPIPETYNYSGTAIKTAIFTFHEDLIRYIAALKDEGEIDRMSDVQIVTIWRPNGFGTNHPAYLVMWEG